METVNDVMIEADERFTSTEAQSFYLLAAVVFELRKLNSNVLELLNRTPAD